MPTINRMLNSVKAKGREIEVFLQAMKRQRVLTPAQATSIITMVHKLINFSIDAVSEATAGKYSATCPRCTHQYEAVIRDRTREIVPAPVEASEDIGG